MQVSQTKSTRISGTSIKAGVLNQFLKGLTEETDISIRVIPKDRPFDSDTITLTASWTAEDN